ncbi:hypothetical protein CRV24_001164 [Beauveria bassiana]|nr:hypothetical protein CRV24_001164 [Beauveria bassiana]
MSTITNKPGVFKDTDKSDMLKGKHPARGKHTASQSDDSGNVEQATTKTTPVYFWYLNNAKDNVPRYTQSLSRSRDPVGTESVVNTFDGRAKVPEEHFNNRSGKYRAIVKLFILYDQQQQLLKDNEAAWPIATGWLVAKDLVVTAGHCAFDHSHGLGRAVKVRAYIGYQGYQNLTNAEGRWGKAIATNPEWCDKLGAEPRDISFIKLESPFLDVDNCFNWTQTPFAQNSADLGVVGYPGDIMDDGERGARMYEMFARTDYRLEDADEHMLQYKIDTYGGVHVLGGQSYNSASVFDGRWGNRFSALQLVANDLSTKDDVPQTASQPDKEHKDWLYLINKETTEAKADLADQMLSNSKRQAAKVVAPVSTHMMNATLSELSFGAEVGPEISILAAAAIATAGRLAADCRTASQAESLAMTRPYDGTISRAVLAEAALQFYYASDGDTQKEAELFMGPVVAGLAPFVLKVAPRLLKGILEPSLRVLVSRIGGFTAPSTTDLGDNRRSRDQAEQETGFGRMLGAKEQEFFDALVNVVKAEPEANISPFLPTMTTIGDFIGSAFKKAGPVLTDVAKIGLPLLLGTEAGGLDAPPAAAAPTYFDPVVHRAMMAEACLQACIERRTELELTESFFKKLLTTVRKVGPKLVNVAPYAAKLVGPIVADILREVKEKKEADEKRQEFLDFSWG